MSFIEWIDNKTKSNFNNFQLNFDYYSLCTFKSLLFCYFVFVFCFLIFILSSRFSFLCVCSLCVEFVTTSKSVSFFPKYLECFSI